MAVYSGAYMKMPKNVFVTVVVAAAVMSVIIVVAIQRGQPPETSTRTDNLANGSYAVGEIVPLADCNIPADVLKPFFTQHDATGARTVLSSYYNENTPLIEMDFAMRTAENAIVPLEVDGLEILNTTGKWSTTHRVHGDRLRLDVQIERAADNIRSLIAGESYYIRNFSAGGNGQFCSSAKAERTFTVPKDLPDKHVYKVRLVLKDELREQRLLAQKEAEKREQERIAEQEKITVTFDTLPDERFVVLYQDGNRSREARLMDSNDKRVLMKGPNALGGELGVFVHPDKYNLTCIAYIENLHKRDIIFPKDADFIRDIENLADLTITLQDRDVDEIAKQEVLSFYISSEAKLPLLVTSLRDKLADMPADAARELSVKIKPGTYYARMGEPMEEETAIGRVTVSAEGPNTWQLKLPE